MVTNVEFFKPGAVQEAPLTAVLLDADIPLMLDRTEGLKGELGEIGYKVINVDNLGTAIEYNFPPPEPGKLHQGSKPEIFIDKSRELSCVVFEINGQLQEVIAIVTDVITPELESPVV